MKYAQVKYKGAEDKIGTHGTVKTGQMLKLTEEEYDCVRDDDRYEFKKWEKVKLPPRNPVGRARHTTLGTTETSGASEDQASASRVSQVNETFDESDLLEDEAAEAEEDYSELTVKELKAEIEVRNEMLEVKIDPASSKKRDLIAALEQNDADEVA